MHSVHRSRIGLMAVLTATFTGCPDIGFTGADCESSADCQTEFQNVPGTMCASGKCVCTDPSHHVCCSRGETRPTCFLLCQPCSECAVGTVGCPAAEGCQTDAECPGPPDSRCGAGRCVEGECQVEIYPGPLASQLKGDCQQLQCSAVGEVLVVADPSDFYNDGEQCTTDFCDGTEPHNSAWADGATCPEAGYGVCHGGECVECWAPGGEQACGPMLACDGKWCVPVHCVNNLFNADLGETDKDCGGPCRPCIPGEHCATDADCRDSICAMETCKVPTCSDGVHNDTETGIDCGAPSCPLCQAGQDCVAGTDCTSGVCWAGLCEAPSCYDGVRNGEEAGVDCGPACQTSCR